MNPATDKAEVFLYTLSPATNQLIRIYGVPDTTATSSTVGFSTKEKAPVERSGGKKKLER
jgi:hypothetical protein